MTSKHLLALGVRHFFIKWVWQRYLGVKSDFFPNNFMIILLIGSARRDRDDDGRAHTRNDTADDYVTTIGICAGGGEV